MLIGLRFLLLFAVMAVAITSLAYLFTRKPKFLALAKTIIKVTLAFAALIAILYIAERLLFI
jgi:hypothetical protein